jgi:TRAP-type C4-dicarboxylate transport system permease small subunit
VSPASDPDGAGRAASCPGLLARAEDWLCVTVLALMCILPVAQMIGRELFGGGIAGSIPATQYLTLAATFLGAALAARQDKHLALATTNFLPERWRPHARALAGLVTVGVTSCLLLACIRLIEVDREFATEAVWGIRCGWCRW